MIKGTLGKPVLLLAAISFPVFAQLREKAPMTWRPASTRATFSDPVWVK